MALINSVEILNGSFAPVNLDETVDWIIDTIQQEKREYLCTVNVSILMMMRSDAFLQKFVDNAGLVVADGAPLIWVSPIFNEKLPERVTGVDLIDPLCQKASEIDAGIYLLGATSEIINTVSVQLKKKFPNLTISGTADGYFGAEEAPQRAQAIADSGAKILIVGMGVPRQEHFIDDYWEKLGVNVAIGVGGSYDVISGLRARAPKIIQKIGMEWAFRLAQEPKRLFRRYLVTNSQFIYLTIKKVLFGGRKGI